MYYVYVCSHVHGFTCGIHLWEPAFDAVNLSFLVTLLPYSFEARSFNQTQSLLNGSFLCPDCFRDLLLLPSEAGITGEPPCLPGIYA